MFDAISLLTSRTGIVIIAALLLSTTLVWGYQQQVGRLKAENLLVQSERDYQARMADALEQQRKALDVAITSERKRRIALEQKWNRIEHSLKGTADYDQSAPASIIRTLNSLSDATAHR